jgi:uncharacterized repeat protein (TIGR03803 family)
MLIFERSGTLLLATSLIAVAAGCGGNAGPSAGGPTFLPLASELGSSLQGRSLKLPLNVCGKRLAISPAPGFGSQNESLTFTAELQVWKPYRIGCQLISSTSKPATWHARGGSLQVINGGRNAIFSSSKLGLYPLNAEYRTFTASTSIVIQRNDVTLLAGFSGHLVGSLLDSSGTLYGVVADNNGCLCDYVFRLPPGASAVQTIYTFTGCCYNQSDGPLVADPHGNLFGSLSNSGSSNGGVVYELLPSGSAYEERVLHRFNNDSHVTGVVADANGALFGTTDGGTVFRLAPSGSSYAYSVLYQFKSTYPNSSGLSPKLAIGNNGELYGTKSSPSGSIVFKLTPEGSSYRESILYRFNVKAFLNGVIVDSAGELYGTTWAGGTGLGFSMVYMLTPSRSGYSASVLYKFGGAEILNGVTLGSGVLYGTTQNGGAAGVGTVYALATNGSSYRLLYTFGGANIGNSPMNDLAIDATGALYGTTINLTWYTSAIFMVNP